MDDNTIPCTCGSSTKTESNLHVKFSKDAYGPKPPQAAKHSELDPRIYTTFHIKKLDDHKGDVKAAAKIHDLFFTSKGGYDCFRALGTAHIKRELFEKYCDRSEDFARQVLHVLMYGIAHGKREDIIWKNEFRQARKIKPVIEICTPEVQRLTLRIGQTAMKVLELVAPWMLRKMGFRQEGQIKGDWVIGSLVERFYC
jgi:hypothetical protein